MFGSDTRPETLLQARIEALFLKSLGPSLLRFCFGAKYDAWAAYKLCGRPAPVHSEETQDIHNPHFLRLSHLLLMVSWDASTWKENRPLFRNWTVSRTLTGEILIRHVGCETAQRGHEPLAGYAWLVIHSLHLRD